jgi:acyl-CoA reductase-like NAD-dependent aldehyde dehydrogenase
MLDAIDGGNPYAAMLVDVRISIQSLHDWPALALALNGQTIPEASPGNLHYTRLEPYGVVGRIVPFNHPVMFAITRILPALIAGNTVVLKPAEQTPLSALVFGEIAAGVLPPGVLNVVTGGPEAGDALVTHPDVKRIAFTGSVPTAMRIQQRTAQFGIKHLSFELGGKNAMIVFPDVDVEDVVDGAIEGMNFVVCQGQSCGSNSRVFVHDDLYEDFLGAAGARLDAMRVGCAYDPSTEMGPLVTQAHYDRVRGYVDAGREEGARLVAGGGRPDGLDGGYFLRPTLFADVAPGMRIAREEIFGPVMSVFRWSDYDSVVRQANDVDLGLTASVWTNDLHLAHKTAAALDAGYVWVNDSTKHYWGTPFGGTKNSGLGREESTDELLTYYELKAVHTILRDPHDALERLSRSA